MAFNLLRTKHTLKSLQFPHVISKHVSECYLDSFLNCFLSLPEMQFGGNECVPTEDKQQETKQTDGGF